MKKSFRFSVTFDGYAVIAKLKDRGRKGEGEREGDWEICRTKQNKIELITKSTSKFDI